MQLKSLFLAGALAASAIATAVPGQQKGVEKRGYGAYCATVTKTTTKCITHVSTKTSTKTTTKTSTKTTTKTSTKTTTKTVTAAAATVTSTVTDTTTVTEGGATVTVTGGSGAGETVTVTDGGATVTVTGGSGGTETVTVTVTGTGTQPTQTGPRFAGCYKENPEDGHILTQNLLTDATGMTQSKCQTNCFNNGFVFAGLTNGTTCACGNGFADSWTATLTDADCNSACSGDSSTSCGGPGLYEVYVDAPKITNVGCYADTGNKYVINDAYTVDPQMTIEQCQTLCFTQQEFSFAALKDGTTCFCNDGFDNPPIQVGATTDCQMPCGGNSAEFCGGNGYVNVYALTN
ncbi:hypothetical protein TWF694_001294 [Orbilia ellipsospora]|uniref:WSC domain-containing protein n=1 Tax=Orbilia ellipsospora TaxID=2528407 RepID=A0AAV9XRZ9_9PEZI